MRAVLACAVGLLTVGCGSKGLTTFMDTDKTAIRASLDSFTVYVVQHRDSTAAAMYAENATFMPPNQPLIQGRAAIRAFIKTVPAMSHFTASPIEIYGRGDLAYVRGTYQVTYVSGAGELGKFLEIRRREPDGRWLITVDIFNTDAPAPPPAPSAARR